MTTEDAFQIIYDLATENIISDSEVAQDPEVLEPIQRAQQQACDILHDFIFNVVSEQRLNQDTYVKLPL